MPNYYFKFEVVGRGQFPIDQLRRFEMFPIDVETARHIEDSLKYDDQPSHMIATRTYALGMYANGLGADAPCVARFASFGFTAEALEVWKDDKLFYKDGEVVAEDRFA